MEEGSTALRVSQSGDGAAPLVIPSIKAPKNGYAFIYLSNENDDAVYFDDFTVSYTRGRIIEENHYYAFGLRISGISSRKYDGGLEGSLKNEFLYNDKELWDEADLNWYDYGFRNYDAQIARFTQLDPLTWDYPELTNYQYASNDPIANVDLDGLEKLSSIIDKSEFFLNKAGEIAVETLAPAVITAKLPAAAAKTASVSTRIFGGIKAVGGLLEAGVGVLGGIATSWTGAGAVGGALVAAHGADVAASGFSQLVSGRPSKSFTEQGISRGLQTVGMSAQQADQWAGNADAGISIVGSGYSGGSIVRGAPAVSSSAAAVGGAAKTSTTALRKVGSALESIDDVMANPNLLKGKSPLQVEGILGKTPGWKVETLGQGSQKGKGWVLRQYNAKGNATGPQLRWHPGGGHHGPTPYWRVVGPNGDLGGIIR